VKDNDTAADASSFVTFTCASCGAKHKVKTALVGKTITCPRTGASVLAAAPLPARPRIAWFVGAAAGLVVLSGVGLVLALSLVKALKRDDTPVAPRENKLAAAVLKVKALECDTIDARSLTGVSDADLAALNGLTSLRHLNLDHAAITDDGVKQIAGIKSLVSLSLTQTEVTDAGLAHLKDLSGLEDLRLDQTGVSDAGLAHLKACPRLTKLSLYQTSVTDVGLVHLKSHYLLERLSLDATKVSDAGLAHLQELDNLRYLSVWQTSVSDAGIDALKMKLPRLRVNK
jgi:Leucine Rich repeat